VTSINKSVVSGLRWVTVSRLFAQALTWVNTLFVIRLLSPTDFGLAAMTGVFANFLLMLNELGLSTTLIRWQIRDTETLRQVFGALLLVGLIFMLALIGVAPALGALAKDPRIVPLMRLMAIQFLTMAFAVIPQARLSIELRFKELSIADLVASLVSAGSTLLLAINHAGPWSLIVGVVVLATTRAVVLNMYCFSIMRPRFQITKLRHLAGFSGLVILEKTLWYWYMQVDSFVVGRSLGVAELGIYGVGRQIASVPLERAMGIINSITLPAFSRVQSDLDQVRRGYLKLLRLGAAYAFPVFWGIGLLSEPIVKILVGSKWLPAVVVIQVLCVSMPLRMLNAFTGTAVVAINRQDVNIKALLFAILVVPTCVVAGSHWGVRGVAAAWAVGFPVVYLFNAALVRGALKISLGEMFIAVSPPAVAAAVMGLAVIGLNALYLNLVPPLTQVLVAVPFAALVFIAALAILSQSAAREMLELVRNVASRGA
jgi:O-antigen/teichoic acid export membrane protein